MNDRENIIALPGEEQIQAEASMWLVVLEREEVSEADLAEFRKWLNQSTRHRATFNSLQYLWKDLAALQELDDIAESVSTIASQHQSTASKGAARNRDFQKRWPWGRMAASFLLGLVLVAVLSQQYMDSLYLQEAHVTAVGEQRTLTLPDGSTLQLNTDSHVQVDYSRASRSIHLEQGEVHFDVERDTRRPFLVYAGGGLVEAVGTAFTVRLRPHDEVEVTVEEGRVALAVVVDQEGGTSQANLASALRSPQQKLAELTAGQSTVFGAQVDRIAQMQPSEINRKLAWRQGLLAYADDPLYSVVADVSRYTDIRIEIVDSELSSMPVAGYFRVGEVHALLDSLELTFGLRVEHVSDTQVRISSSR